jgi:hypothetical protein
MSDNNKPILFRDFIEDIATEIDSHDNDIILELSPAAFISGGFNR